MDQDKKKDKNTQSEGSRTGPKSKDSSTTLTSDEIPIAIQRPIQSNVASQNVGSSPAKKSNMKSKERILPYTTDENNRDNKKDNDLKLTRSVSSIRFKEFAASDSSSPANSEIRTSIPPVSTLTSNVQRPEDLTLEHLRQMTSNKDDKPTKNISTAGVQPNLAERYLGSVANSTSTIPPNSIFNKNRLSHSNIEILPSNIGTSVSPAAGATTSLATGRGTGGAGANSNPLTLPSNSQGIFTKQNASPFDTDSKLIDNTTTNEPSPKKTSISLAAKNSFPEDQSITANKKKKPIPKYPSYENLGFHDRKPKIPFTQFIYNRDTKQYLGRTCKRWCQLLLFYIIFYAAVISFSYGYLRFWFKLRIDDMDTPSNEFKLQPDFTYYPRFDAKDRGVLIYDPNCKTNYMKIVKEIQTFLYKYERNYNLTENYGPCYTRPYFGYNETTPCVYIKLNKISNYLPKPYTDTKDFPKGEPKQLIDYINKNIPVNKRHYIWLHCVNTNNMKNIGFTVYPLPGFDVHDVSTHNLKIPLHDKLIMPIALHLYNITKNKVLVLTCTFYAHNFIYEKKSKERYGPLAIRIKVL